MRCFVCSHNLINGPRNFCLKEEVIWDKAEAGVGAGLDLFLVQLLLFIIHGFKYPSFWYGWGDGVHLKIRLPV